MAYWTVVGVPCIFLCQYFYKICFCDRRYDYAATFRLCFRNLRNLCLFVATSFKTHSTDYSIHVQKCDSDIRDVFSKYIVHGRDYNQQYDRRIFNNYRNNCIGMEILKFYILVAIGVFLSSCSQIVLKKSVQREHKSKIAEILNRQVIFAYSLFFISVFINVVALRHGVKVKDLPILEALGYIFVPMMSLFFLKEKICKNNIIALSMIITGIIVFYL